MIIKLPTIKRIPVEENGEIVDIKVEREEIPFSLDLSAYSELRFQTFFKDNVADDSLSEYASRIAKIDKTDLSLLQANYISILKVLYCYLESEKVPTFIEFAKLFDISITGELLSKTKSILELAFKSTVKN